MAWGVSATIGDGIQNLIANIEHGLRETPAAHDPSAAGTWYTYQRDTCNDLSRRRSARRMPYSSKPPKGYICRSGTVEHMPTYSAQVCHFPLGHQSWWDFTSCVIVRWVRRARFQWHPYTSTPIERTSGTRRSSWPVRHEHGPRARLRSPAHTSS